MPRDNDPASRSFARRTLFVIFSIITVFSGFCARAIYSANHPCHWRAPNSYIAIAQNLAQGKGFIDTASNFEVPDRTRRPPLAPYVISRLILFDGRHSGIEDFLFLQALLGAYTALLIALLGWRLTHSRAAYFFLLPIYSFWGAALVLAPCAMTETFFIFFFAASALALLEAFRRPHWRRFALAGLLVGLASLTRPILYPLYFFLAAAWPWLFQKTAKIKGSRKAAFALLFFAALMLVILPWMVRNSRINGRLTLITSSIGLNLLMQNSPYDMPGTWQWAKEASKPGGELAQMDEARRDAILMGKAFDYIRRDPGRFLKLAAERFILVYNDSDYNFPPLPTPLRWNTKFAFLLAIGLAALFAARFNEGLLFALLLLNFNVVYCLTFFEARFRETVMPVHLALATMGAAYVIRKVQAWRRRKRSVDGRA